MAHVIHSINITVGGSCHHADALADEEHHRYALDVLTSANAVLLGRNTFDLFASFWPEAASRPDLPSYLTGFAAELEAKPKYVVSSRSLDAKWKNTGLLHGVDDVRRFLAGTRGTVVVFGSPGLGTSLLAAGLVHEIHVLLQPLIGTTAPAAFERLPGRKGLVLIDARPFRSGVVLLRYGIEA